MTNKLVAFWLLNLYDTIATLWLINNRVSIEHNPFMAALIDFDHASFVAVKLTVATAICFLLSRCRAHHRANLAANMALALYVPLALWNSYWLGYAILVLKV